MVRLLVGMFAGCCSIRRMVFLGGFGGAVF